MLNFYLFTGISFILCILGYRKKQQYIWMSMDFTKTVKGFAILTVLWAHIGAVYDDLPIQFIAGIGVSLFIICSGYGLEASYQKKGLNGFWKQRIVTVWVPLILCHTVATIIRWIIGLGKPLGSTILVLLFVEANWYLKFIVTCYIAFFIIKKYMFKYERMAWITFVIISFILYTALSMGTDAPFLEARQVLSFPTGILIYKNKRLLIDKINKYRGILFFFMCFAIGTVFMALTQHPTIKELPVIAYNILSVPTCYIFAMGILILGLSYSKLFSNWVLNVIGLYSYEVYLIQYESLGVLNNKIYSLLLFVGIIFIGALGIKKFTSVIRNSLTKNQQ